MALRRESVCLLRVGWASVDVRDAFLGRSLVPTTPDLFRQGSVVVAAWKTHSHLHVGSLLSVVAAQQTHRHLHVDSSLSLLPWEAVAASIVVIAVESFVGLAHLRLLEYDLFSASWMSRVLPALPRPIQSQRFL